MPWFWEDEDYAQMRAKLRYQGHTSFDSADVIDRLRFKHRLYARSEARILPILPSYGDNRSGLSMILDPDLPQMQSIPVYDRYVAYLIANYDNRDAAPLLGMSRQYLWKWLQRHGYKPHREMPTLRRHPRSQ